MINISTIIDSIVTDLKAQSWTSPNGGDTTSFVDVFNFRHWAFKGSPFICVLDNPISGQTDSNKSVFLESEIELHICSNFAEVEAQTKTDQRRIAMQNLREAWDFLKGHAMKESTLLSWFGSNIEVWTPELQIEDSNILELNLYRRIVKIKILEEISRLD